MPEPPHGLEQPSLTAIRELRIVAWLPSTATAPAMSRFSIVTLSPVIRRVLAPESHAAPEGSGAPAPSAARVVGPVFSASG